MDVNTLRIAVTLLSFLAFIGIVAFAWSRRNQGAFSEAERLPFLDSMPMAEQSTMASRP